MCDESTVLRRGRLATIAVCLVAVLAAPPGVCQQSATKNPDGDKVLATRVRDAFAGALRVTLDSENPEPFERSLARVLKDDQLLRDPQVTVEVSARVERAFVRTLTRILADEMIAKPGALPEEPKARESRVRAIFTSSLKSLRSDETLTDRKADRPRVSAGFARVLTQTLRAENILKDERAFDLSLREVFPRELARSLREQDLIVTKVNGR